jgi:hypothetical protein
MAGPLQIVFKSTPSFGGTAVDCPEEPGKRGAVIRLYVTPAGVLGSCGRKHRYAGAHGRRARPADCMFQVAEVTKEELQALAAPGKTGKVRGKLPTGKAVEAEIISFGDGKGVPTGGGKAAQAFGQSQGGGGAPARVPRGGGGAAAAFFNAIGATAMAAGQVAGSAASIVGSAADLGKEGIGLARDGVREAGAYGERRHERKLAQGDGAGDGDGE